MPARDPTAAERQREYQRAYRERLKRGLLGFSGYAPPALVERLINENLLPEDEASNKESLGAALLTAAERGVR